tara:strand:- start:419 stop:1267 length:849 start_codon:yes stop_codon:yes gene_type:complete
MDNATLINSEQQEFWNSDSAHYWISQKQALDQLLEPWACLLLDAADLSGRENIADIGCGSGATTLKFAASLNMTGRITGIDLSKRLIDTAISTAQARAVENVSFVEADAAQYRFQSPQDLMISRCGVMFFGDFVAAFSNLRASLSNTGRVLFVVWREPEENDWYQFPVRCAAAFSEEEQQIDPNAPGAFALADPSRVQNILESAGFRNIRLRAVTEKLCVGQTVQSATDMFLAMDRIRKLLDHSDTVLVDKVKRYMVQGLADYQQESGVYMNGTCWLVSASV